VLEVERETWRQVCQKLGSKKGEEGPTPSPLPGVSAPQTAPAAPLPASAPPLGPVPGSSGFDDSAPSGFSLEA